MKRFIFITLLLCANIASAESSTFAECQLTPAIWATYPPPTFTTSNNLRRKSGSYKFAQGHFVNIVGRVLDSNCTPVTGATVRIWQTNAMGVLENDPNAVDDKDPNFSGSGTAVTNNLGFYSFFTVMPAATENRAPHIKLSVYHSELAGLETEMFFPNQHLNERDQTLKRQLNIRNRKLLLAKQIGYDKIENADIYEFNITLEGKLNYKQY